MHITLRVLKIIGLILLFMVWCVIVFVAGAWATIWVLSNHPPS